MKKVIAAVVFMLLVAVFAQFGASDVAFANDGKTMPLARRADGKSICAVFCEKRIDADKYAFARSLLV